MKDKSIDSKNISAPHIDKNKGINRAEPSATIFVLSTDPPTLLSGDSPLTTPKEVLSSNTPSLRTRGKSIKDRSPDIEVSLDEITKMPELDLENLTLEQIIMLQEILVKKKQQNELRREHKKK